MNGYLLVMDHPASRRGDFYPRFDLHNVATAGSAVQPLSQRHALEIPLMRSSPSQLSWLRDSYRFPYRRRQASCPPSRRSVGRPPIDKRMGKRNALVISGKTGNFWVQTSCQSMMFP
jgi:hypothetical protein